MLCSAGIEANAQLKADFTMDPPAGGCSPLSVNFFNTTTGASAAATYEWDFGNNSNKGYDKDAGTVYIIEKTYTVTLTVKDGTQTSTATKTVTVYKHPTAAFSFAQIKGCAPYSVDFSSNATAGDGTITRYLWDFGDGNIDTTSNAPNVSHLYTSAATPPVSLTVVNSYGCYITVDKSGITILPPLTAAFNAAKAALCTVGESATFNNTSTGPGTLTYTWSFGDGGSSTDKQPVHPYNQKGSFDVSLIVKSSEGCVDTLNQPDYINVANFVTDFDMPAVVCTNALTDFTNKSTPVATSTLWEISGVPGQYSGENFNYTFTTPGTYTVKLTNTYSTCSESKERQMNVKAGPKIDGFIYDLKGACGAPVTVQFKDTSTSSVKWEWNFGNGQMATVKEPSYTYNNDGSYQVLLSATNPEGCVNKVSQNIVLSKPDINIVKQGNDNGCPGFSMDFSVDKPADVKSYHWDFGDGDTSAAANPSHTFTKVGNYTVTLTYTTQSDCAGKATYSTVSVYQKPKADFSVSDSVVCGRTAVNFTNLTGGNVSDWQWDFGDGTNGSGSSPTHNYNQDGDYTVTLIVGNGTCKDTLKRGTFLKVLPPFPKILSRQQTCNSGEVIFYQDTANKAVKTWWDFGDDITEEVSPLLPSITHVYNKTGKYQAYLIAENGQCNVRDSIMLDVLLQQTPKLEAQLTEVCGSGDLVIKISGLERNPAYLDDYNNHYTITSWQYGDGTAFTPTYTSTGNYFVTDFNATITNLNNGQNNIRAIISSTTYPYCADTTNFITLKIKGPKAVFGYTQNGVCFKKPVIFKDQSLAGDGVVIKKWEWNFSDGDTLSYADTSYPLQGLTEHQYKEPGFYYPVLKVTDADGCTSTTDAYSQNYASVKGPRASFVYSPDHVFPNTPVYFTNTTNASNSNPQYNWFFSGGAVYNNTYAPPSKTYTALGQETITLIAKDPSGCTDTAVQTLYIKDVAAAFTHSESYVGNTTCPPVIVRFVNHSENQKYVFWTFGDGGTSDLQAATTHTYNKAGHYKVVLYAYGNSTYVDSAIEYITIKGPYAVLKADTLSGCLNQNVTLSAEVINASSYTWDFGDGNLKQTTDTFATHSYATAGIYQPALIMKDGDGCSGNSELPDKIVIDSLAILAIQKNPVNICDSAMVTFDPVVKSIAAEQLQKQLTYAWNFGMGNSGTESTDSIPSYYYNQPGRFAATVKVKSPYGCEKAATHSVIILQTPEPKIEAPPAICENGTITYKGSADMNTELLWHWNFGNGNESDLQLPAEQQYNNLGIITVTLSVDNQGCKSTATQSLIVNRRPVVNLTPKESAVCLGNSLQLKAEDGIQYSWSPAAGLSATNIASPVATPTDNITYTVNVKNEFGCMRADSAKLTVAKPFTIQLVPDTFVCIGSTVQLPVTGADSYEWINTTTGLNSTTSDKPVASPATNTTYTVVGADKYQCFTDTKSVTVAVKPLPAVKAPDDMQLLTGSTVQLPAVGSSDVVKYSWSPPDYLDCTTCQAPQSEPRRDIDYIVTAQTQFGCMSADTVSIKLICAQTRVYIPNAFTPDGDRRNDIFYVKGKGIRSIKSMRVYNRWGQVVYETFNANIEDPLRGWDGNYNGRQGEGAVYVYYIEFICDTGEVFAKKGTITLIR